MDVLVIGIDGADQKILDYFDGEFYRELKSRLEIVPVTEDLYDRGWAKIVTGLPGSATRGFYMAPVLDGTYRFSDSYRVTDPMRPAEVIPIWDLLNDQGHSVGIMNVPTTYPASAVDGFLIASLGGGLFSVDGIPDELVSPSSVKPVLESLGYVPDIRLKPSGIKDMAVLFDRLIDMEHKRVDAYLKLVSGSPVDFGFIVDRGTTIVQYLLMSEIHDMMSRSETISDLDTSVRPNWSLLESYYKQLDRNLKHLVEEIDPKHVVIVGDHGHAPFTHRGNVNAFLERHHWYTKAAAVTSYKNRVRKLARKIIPKMLRRNVVKSLPNVIGQARPNFDKNKTLAFGHNYVYGIFINDERRFGGPVPESDIQELVDIICVAINDSNEAAEYKFKAVSYRAYFEGAAYADWLPDIKIDGPDSLYFDGQSAEFIRPNQNYGPVDDLSTVTKDVYTGMKSRTPLLMMDAGLMGEQGGNPQDLTVVYKVIKHHFESLRFPDVKVPDPS